MNRFQGYRVVLSLLVLWGISTAPDTICMNPGAKFGGIVGSQAKNFFASAIKAFLGSNNSDFTRGDFAKVCDKVFRNFVEEAKQINAGPAIKEFKDWMAQNKRAAIKGIILSTLGGTALTCTAMGMQYGTYFIWKYGSEIFAKYILMRMEKPRVIINSSTLERPGYIRQFINIILRKKPCYDEMIFAPHITQQLDDTIKQTHHINTAIRNGKKNITYRNLLLWGPPGTGKTMFARKLARMSSLEWVEITGSSLFTKGAGIAAIDELFEWANKSKRGLLIFIDEADSLLPDRTTMDPNSDNYKIINHFLNYLGTKSNKFMIVMSTNHKVAFDAAMRRRIHDSIHLPLPELEQRVQLLNLYAEKTLFNEKLNSEEFAACARRELTATKIQAIAEQTAGFSSDEMATLVETIKSLTDISEEGVVTHTIIDRAVKRQLEGRQGFTVAGTTSVA
jgi:Holliday junction resolvasome RuvABC ATP-dependent DNA helicase subunit